MHVQTVHPTSDDERTYHASLDEFFSSESNDLFDKVRRFYRYEQTLRKHGVFQAQYRVALESPLDHRIMVRDPNGGPDREMICFDSNSYLGLHLHPRVRRAVTEAVEEFGVGTPSAQVLGGTNRHLLELEALIAATHKRDAALIFPSGYQANVGILTGLLRREDIAFVDENAHASIHDGCRFARCRAVRTYRHCDVEHLDALLHDHAGGPGAMLVVTDGLFSMHGDLAPLPELLEVCERRGATLMVDDAHSLGIIGSTGRGIEEHFGLEGRVPLFMGTFSKAPGAVGGYVCGDVATIEYLRFFARSSLFTATLPAAICAGVAESVRVMHDEPEHRLRLWHNARTLWEGLDLADLQLRPLSSPIIPIRVGDEHLMGPVSVELFDAGIKCGIAQFPAVPRGESLLRLTVCSRHTREDLGRTIAVLSELAQRYRFRRSDLDRKESIS